MERLCTHPNLDGCTAKGLSMRRIETEKPSRAGKIGLTVHTFEPVRRQLKALAAVQGRSMDDAVHEALNLLFALHGRPEIAPRKGLEPSP